MILVDTSVIIDFLKERHNAPVEKFNKILDLEIPFGIASFTYLELLQGTATQRDFEQLKKYLDTFTIYAPRNDRDSYAQAAYIYFQCRRKGITVRSTIDCLIVQIAREHGLKLLHNDKYFLAIPAALREVEFF